MRYRLIIVLIQDRNGEHTAFKPFVHHFFFCIITAKVAQKIVSKDNPDSFVLGDALGANISGVITSAIITGIYITIIPYL